MTDIAKALVWAALILLVAFVMKMQGVSASASAGVSAALAAAAWGTIRSKTACGKGCVT